MSKLTSNVVLTEDCFSHLFSQETNYPKTKILKSVF